MGDTVKRTGTCLCGATGLTARAASSSVGACHCTVCRRWGGGPYLSVDCGPDVDLEGKSDITVYESSQWAERGFCRKCGTHLFYRLKETQHYIVAAGILDPGDGEVVFDHQVFIDEKPDYYNFEGDMEKLTGKEVFAMFLSSGK